MAAAHQLSGALNRQQRRAAAGCHGDVGTIDAIDSDNSELSVLFQTYKPGATGSRAVVACGWGELDHTGTGVCLHD